MFRYTAPVRVAELEEDDKSHALNRVIAPVDVVAHEKVVGVCQPIVEGVSFRV